MASDAVRVFVDRQLELLAAERAAEVEQTKLLLSNVPFSQLERAGLALGALGVAQVSVGLGGKTLVSLERPAAWHTSTDFPAHGLRTGDLVRIQTSEAKRKAAAAGKDKDAPAVEGVIARVLPARIVVALRGREDADVDLPERCALVKLTNDATFDRMERAMQSVLRAAESPSDVLRVLLGMAQPSFASAGPSAPPLVFLDDRLNASQRAAAQFVLREAREVGLIHGPPGTGKTQTLVEVIRQLVLAGQRVLVCGASNLAVDNLVERLSLHKVPLTRLGHPARVLASVHDATLDSQIQHSSSGAIVKDVKAELEALMGKLTKGKMRGAERRAGWAEVKELRKEFRKRENGVVDSVVSQARVVLSTCHGAGSRQIASAKFDVVVIDEAAQALEAVCWVPILKGAKVILLPPTIKSRGKQTAVGDKAAKLNKPAASTGDATALSPSPSLETTLFDRLLAMHGDRIKRTLTVQYRYGLGLRLGSSHSMHERIMAFPSHEMYDNLLIADDAVKGRLLSDLVAEPSEAQADELIEPLVFFDTAGADFFERSDAEDSLHADSKSNENEATIVVRHVDALLAAGVPAASITIISGYQAQVALLASYLRPKHPDIEIGTVDAFQGRENDVVIVSLVRSNEKREVGFLSESRRLNVAMTRPRRQLCVVGDSETVAKGTPFLKRWMAHLEEHADLRPVAMLDL